jgi:hypothetical protein
MKYGNALSRCENGENTEPKSDNISAVKRCETALARCEIGSKDTHPSQSENNQPGGSDDICSAEAKCERLVSLFFQSA